jgi:hypothetical protein
MNFVKASTTYEIEVEGRVYQFVIPLNAPLGESYDVAFKFLSVIAEQTKLTTETLKPKESDIKKETIEPEIVQS